MNILPPNGPRSDVNRTDSFGAGDDTLRLIASLPAPEGLADRVNANLRTAPEPGRILMWRGSLVPVRGWMYTSVARGAAAAAIVCLVAGGGWRIYSHVQPGPSANMIVMPAPGTAGGGGFSTSNAKRVPDTLDKPVLTHSAVPAPELNGIEKMPGLPKAGPGVTAPKKKKAHRSALVPVQ